MSRLLLLIIAASASGCASWRRKPSKRSQPRSLAPPGEIGAKARLRAMFEQKRQVTFAEIEVLAAELGVQPTTVTTMLSDLKNPRYAVPDGPLNIAKEKGAERYVVQK